MQVNFYANLRAIAGRTTIEYSEHPSRTLRELLSDLIQRYPDMRSHLFDSENDLRQDVPIFVNGRNPRLAKGGLDEPLQPDDVVSLFSPVASGRMNVEVLRVPTFGRKE